MRKELERCRTIIRKAESQGYIPTKEEILRWRQKHNEDDGVDVVPDVVSRETYEEAKLRAWELEEQLEAVED